MSPPPPPPPRFCSVHMLTLAYSPGLSIAIFRTIFRTPPLPNTRERQCLADLAPVRAERVERAGPEPIGMQAQGLRNILEACRDDGMDDGFLEKLTVAMEKVVQDRGGNGGIALIGEYLLEGQLTEQ
ncbi:hypothetical protein EDB80DRAFT_693587 [Ilyonectria destructans]|nr:hypothetical protein EDB80DRAFT_693587 [Ilyonectria destructans]